MDNEHESNLIQRNPRTRPFTFPMGSRIIIHKMIHGKPVPNHIVSGILEVTSTNYIPPDNRPYGNAFIILNNGTRYYAPLKPSPNYDEKNNNVQDGAQEYSCFVTRPLGFGLEALLKPFSSVHQLSGIARVDYISRPDVNVSGYLRHSDFGF